MYSYGPPTHGRAKAGRPARTYIQQLCEDTGCCPEDLPRAMNDREEWRERVRDIRATSSIWWWWYQHDTGYFEHNLRSNIPRNSNCTDTYLPSHKPFKQIKLGTAGQCWRSRNELISGVLIWTPTQGCGYVSRPATIYLY